MESKDFDLWLQRIYHSGPHDQNSIEELHSFVKSEESLPIILNALKSNILSKSSLLISLSCIPNCKITSVEQIDAIKEWFINFCFNQLEYDNSLIQLLVNIFIFLYEDDQKNGADLIQKFSDGGFEQKILAIEISSKIIMESANSSSLIYLIPLGVEPFSLDEAPKCLLHSAANLLKIILSNKSFESQHYPTIIMKEFLKMNFPKRLFDIVIKFNGTDLPECMFALLNELLKFPNSSFPSQKIKEDFFAETIVEITNYMKNFEISINVLSSLSILLTTLKTIISTFNEFSQEILIEWIDVMVEFTLNVISPEYLTENTSPAEIIFNFWKVPIKKGFLSSKEETKALLNIKQNFINNLFSKESIKYQNLILQILTDQSSQLIGKFVSICQFDICSISEFILDLINDFIQDNFYLNAAICIEFLANAIKIDELTPFVDKIMQYISHVIDLAPVISNENEESQIHIYFELSLLHFFNGIFETFLQNDKPISKHFVDNFKDELIKFLIRFLTEIQTNNASIELIMEVTKILQFKNISQYYLSVIASNEQIFDLISTSKIIATNIQQSKKATKTLFASLFYLGFSLNNPERSFLILKEILQRFELNKNDQVGFAMLSGAFKAPNCRFGFLFNTLKGFLEKCFEIYKDKNTDINFCYTIFHLFLDMTNVIDQEDYLSPNIISFFQISMNISLETLSIISRISEDINYFRFLSIIFRISINFLKSPSVNIGILKYYGITSFYELTQKLFNVLLTIPYKRLFEYPKFLIYYIQYLSTLFSEYVNVFFELDEYIINHQIQTLTSIINLDKKELFLNSASALCCLIESLDNDKVIKYHNYFLCVISLCMKLSFEKSFKNSTIFKLLYISSKKFIEERNLLLDKYYSIIEDEGLNNQLHLIFSQFINIIESENEQRDTYFSNSISSIASFFKKNGIQFK